MIGTLIGIIIVMIFLGVAWWAIQQLMPLIPLGEPFRTIIYVLMVVLMVCIVVWVMLQILAVAGIPVPAFSLNAHSPMR